ncbi:MAG: AAA family ATPase [Alphaproteobacteria bacterium]|nr:AAA family ATPase [Alphaproteobacteria bacterium]
MIQTLTICDFRNHECSRIKIDSAKNIVLYGPNGGGKTSVLEALSAISASGSLRGAAPPDIVRIGGAGQFGVTVVLQNDTELSVSFELTDAKRRARIDSDAAPISDLSRHIRMVWITPREDRLFVDSASDRRAFFDRLVSGFDTAHTGRVIRLSKLLSERAFALKSGANPGWLAALERQLSDTAISVAAARVKYAGEINYFLGDDYSITISGMLEEKLANAISAADAGSEYLEYLSKNRELIGDKMSIDGPHRADFGMINNVLAMPVAMTSTGQQKSALMRLVLSHAKLLRARASAPVLILLDEVAAHLDKEARAALFAELDAIESQVWMTGLERESFNGISNSKFIYCENGCVYDK